MYDILPRANSLRQRPRASGMPGNQFLVCHSPARTLCKRAYCGLAASHVPLTKDGVASRLTVAWNRVLQPNLDGIQPRIPRAFSLKSITSRIISHSRKVNL
jgi:hypothetical protein